MPIITVESSVALAPEQRTRALQTIVGAVNDLLAIEPPTQLRVRIVDVPLESVAIGDAVASPDEPWIVAYANVLEGRAAEQITDFMSAFAQTLADVFGVEPAKVRVLVQHLPATNWQIGRRSAAALGR